MSCHGMPDRCETLFVQVICIKDKIMTGTKYSIMKKLNMANLSEKKMIIYLINN
jgi:hypothetical protein